jgi:hypothetical protein
MPGLIRKCREGEAFRVGEATIRVLRTGRKAVISIIAPSNVRIEHIANEQPASVGERTDGIDAESIDAHERF